MAVVTLPDGTVLVASGGEDRRVLRWNAVTGEPIRAPLTGPKHWIMRLSFRSAPDGRTVLVAVDDDDRIHGWDAVTGQRVSS